ncbi:phage tail tape measure protein [Rhizobium sp. C1]|uniref:phage tail tape measure protein n=1 Tax=Rhizobium sp. C1 TaxID=1349799 RepID=UPI001E5774AA|nr:phage tail tape measure protein [Rhizobium sp. C1]MCD2176440.1 phage tail tape measure protein [Rhizobium sp. C1]
MSGRNMALDVLVRLKDLLSGPLKRATGVVKGFTDTIRKIGLVGTALAAISFTAPIAQAAEFQQKLLDIATTAELTHKAAFDFVNQQKAQYEGLSFTYGQFSDTIAAGAGKMIAAGLDRASVETSLGAIAKNATAANAQFEDVAGVAISLMQTLRIPADQMDSSIAGLIVSAKAGSFEFKEMARYFPTLTSQVAKFGVTGREAVNFLGAALQIAMKGTSEPAEAANNLKNFLSKILAPVTVKTFKEAGVDIQAVMQDAATKGINPIEAVIQKIMKLTGVSAKEIQGLMDKAKANGLSGAEALGYVREQLEKIHGAGKLGELFQDQQVLDFLIPFLAHLEEYKQIKEDVAKATGANSQADFETQIQGLNRQFMIFQEIGVQAVREVGLAFGVWLPAINQHLIEALKWLRETDERTGGMVRHMLSLGGAAVAAAAALGVLGVVAPIISGGLSLLAGPLRLLWTALSFIPAALGAVGGALAGISAPIWATIAAVAALSFAIYRYWQPIQAFVTGFASSFKGPFEATVSSFQWFFSAIGLETSKLGPLLDGMKTTMTAWWNDLKSFFSGIDFGSMFSMKQYSAADLASFNQLGRDLGDSIVNGIKSAVDGLIEWFSSLPSRILAAIGKIDLSGIISWPSLPSWLGGGGPPGTPQPATKAEQPANQNVSVDVTTTVKAAPGTTVTGQSVQTSGAKNSGINTGKSVGAP